VILSGCATGLHPEIVDQMIDNSAYKGDPKAQPNANKGKTAVWMNIETMNSECQLEQKWKWNKSDLDIVTSYLKTFGQQGKFTPYYFVKTSELEARNTEAFLKGIPEGTESAIVIRTIVKVDRYFNPAAILDLTIIGAYWFPGSNRDAFAKTRIEVINTKTKALISSAEGEGTAKISKPSFLIDTEEAVSLAKSESLRDAMRDLFKKLSARQKLWMTEESE